MKFQKSFTLIASLLISACVFSQDYDPRIRPALKASCDCFENASELNKQYNKELLTQCIQEGMTAADLEEFTSFFDINFNTSTEKDIQKMGEEFRGLLMEYCPSFAIYVLESFIEEYEEETGGFDKDDGLWDIDETTGTVTIPMTMSGSTFTVPVILNDALKIDMLFDSGAADVSISSDVFLTLVRTGTIEDGDILGESTYILADGSTVEETQINLRSIELGGQVLTNVRASVSSNLDDPLLLGQSVMSRFGTITIDYNNEEVILRK